MKMLNLKIYLNIFLYLFSFVAIAMPSATDFDFSNDLENWIITGSGEGKWDKTEGYYKDGSLYLSTQWGDERTANYQMSNLKAGLYELTAWVKMFEVQLPSKGDAFSLFYNNGIGVKSVFRDVHGSSEWSQIKYNVTVTEKGILDIWFRLKTPGKIWIDDISLVKTNEPSMQSIFTRSSLKLSSLKKYLKSETPQPQTKNREIELFSFEKTQEEMETGHPFVELDKTIPLEGLNSAILRHNKKYSFNLKKMKVSNWSAFEYIELSVYNPIERAVPFYLVLSDSDSVNYWSQLNHKTKLAKGWNKLSFNLKQWLGERGKHKIKRSLDLKDLKKFFITVDPGSKHPTSRKFLIDKIRLTSKKSPIIPKGVFAFDFTNHSENVVPGFFPVTSQTLFRKEREYGFVDAKFWKMQDSVYANKLHRYSISLTEGSFRIKLPNGRYIVHLVIDGLGYKEIPFWRNRALYLQNKPVFKESRPFGKDYLIDYLRFEGNEPGVNDNPYDSFLSKIFKTHTLEAFVSNGVLDLGFKGDPTGINLNSLIIYEKKMKKTGDTFLRDLDNYERENYARLTRKTPATKRGLKTRKKTEVSLVSLSSRIEPTDYLNGVKTELNFWGPKGMRHRQLIQLYGLEKDSSFKLKLGKLKTKNGNLLSTKGIQIKRLVNTFISENLNHETYLLAGKYFKSAKNKNILVPKGESRFVLLDIPVNEEQKGGVYTGFFKVSVNKTSKLIPVEIKVNTKKLPKVDLAVGFIGLDPLTKTHFRGTGYKKLRWLYRDKALKLLGSRGFTSFSGFPKAPILKRGETWDIDMTPVKRVFSKAKKYGLTGPFFSYGGDFPEEYFSAINEHDPQSRIDLHKKMSPIFEAALSSIPKEMFVYTYRDEVEGNSGKIESDTEYAKFLKKNYSSLKIGGFSQIASKEQDLLNRQFDYGLYTNFKKGYFSKDQKWGTFNGSPKALDDPRFGFGPILFAASKEGLSHYLDWHTSNYNNYPYFDLDGRESEVAMFYPKSDGSLLTTLKFELSSEGLQDYRLLKMLEKSLRRNSPKKALFKKNAQKWLNKQLKLHSLYSSNDPFKTWGKGNYTKFQQELRKHLKSLLE